MLICPERSPSNSSNTLSKSFWLQASGCFSTHPLNSCKVIMPLWFESILLKVSSSFLICDGGTFSEINLIMFFLKFVSACTVKQFFATSMSRGVSEICSRWPSASQLSCNNLSNGGRSFGFNNSIFRIKSLACLLAPVKCLLSLGLPDRMLRPVSRMVLPSKGDFPESSWYKMAPRDHTSLAALAFAPRSLAGKFTNLWPLGSYCSCFCTQGPATSGAM
mmetsp:Transcript_151521/g.486245  ORF Transcript_151521/g.486245 Transcript_151521/m.486245 type:complete len:219 (+) Transcript_151521:473-1129(+)